VEKEELGLNLLDEAYKCKPDDLESMLERIELAIKNNGGNDRSLFRAKTIITSKMALCHSK